MVEIEIDGQKIQAEPNTMVIQVADEAGIYIPRFCYHKHLSVAANCRMCLVEVEKSPKALPACATPIMDGMKVFTRSPKAIAAQKAVMEFLLINHPLDCPICDQGGECELQDLSMGYGSDTSTFCEGKRSVKDKDLGPLIATEMTRCIQCTRCVRFGDEIAGFRELGGVNRGEHLEITTYVTHAMRSEVSANIIDLCPVGALTSKPYRFTSRPWELQQFPSIAAHDCLGSNVNVHTRGGKVMRVVPRENIKINQVWLSDRDRFSYQGLYHVDRLAKPMIRINGELQETDWQTALEYAVQGIQQTVVVEGPDQLAALASPNSTVEEFYLLQKLMRSLGSSNIDHRLRQVDFSDQASQAAFPKAILSDLDSYDTILLIGSNIQKEQPLAALRLRKAALKGVNVMAVNMLDYAFHFNLVAKEIVAPQAFVGALKNIVENPEHAIHEKIRAGQKVGVILGALALNHPEAAKIRALAHKLGTVNIFSEGANAAGAWLAGAIPHRGPAATAVTVGADAHTLLRKSRKTYLLLNVEPDLDCADSVAATQAMEKADFVVSLSVFKNAVLDQYASVILPVAPFTETSGTFVNVSGEWQSFKGVANPFGESRPAWKVLRVLANLLDRDNFEYTSSEAIRNELKEMVMNMSPLSTVEAELPQHEAVEISLARIGEVPLYSTDGLVRRSASLQATQTIIEGNMAAVRMNALTAAQLRVKETEPVIVKQHHQSIRLPVLFDERVPNRAVLIASGILASSGLGELFGPVEIQKL